MDCRWVEEIGKFQEIRGEWDEAVIGSGAYNPFLLSDFIITWWKHFGGGRALRIFVVYDGQRITGGLPLYIRKGGCREAFARSLCYVGDHAANYTEPLYAGPEAEVLPMLKNSLAAKRDWDVLYLTDLRPESRMLSECRGMGTDRRFSLRIFQDHMNWAIDLSMGQEKYLSAISSKLRRDLRAKRRHLESDLGELKLRAITGEAEVERHFDLYAEFSVNTFAERDKNSNFENRRYAGFFREFLVLMDRNRRLDAYALTAGDKILALGFGYRFGKGFNWVLTAYNPEHRYFRPGYLLIEELIKLVLSRGETCYNWYGYERFYKSQWCNNRSPLYSLAIVRSSIRGRAYRALRSIVRRVRGVKGAL